MEKSDRSYEVHLAGAVIDEVERGHEEDSSQWCPCSIKQYIDNGSATRIDLSIKDIPDPAAPFGPQFLDALYGGEQESLAQLFKSMDLETAICSGDNTAHRILGAISLNKASRWRKCYRP